MTRPLDPTGLGHSQRSLSSGVDLLLGHSGCAGGGGGA